MPNWKKVIVSGSNAALNSLNITSALTASGLIYPTTDGDEGDSLVTDGVGNLSFIRPSVLANVKNVSGVTLIKGTPVHAIGAAGNSSTVIAASASVAATMPATFILNETIADDVEGLALLSGFLNMFDTSDFLAGDTLYVGINGGYTNVRPTGSTNLIQNLGIATKIDAINGSGYIYGSGRSNDIPNLPKGKIWVGDGNTVTSSIVYLDEDNSHAQITGSLSVSSVINAGVDTDKFLVLDSTNNIDFRTGAEVRSDIGAGTGNGTVTGTGANNQVTTWNGTTSLDGSSNFTYDGTTLNLSYTGTGDLLRLTSTDAGAASAPDLTFCRDSASPADDDTLGTIQFYGEVDGASVCKNYASIYGRIACATNGQTKGNLSFKAECNNVFVDTANFSPNGLYVLPPDDFAITSPGIGLTVTGGVSGSTTLQIGLGHTMSSTNFSSIAGGYNNDASGDFSFIGGGDRNQATITNTIVVGGTLNTASASHSFIGGGCLNSIKGSTSKNFIGGGEYNNIVGSTNSGHIIVGGSCNLANNGDTGGGHSTIVGGCLNTASGAFGFIGGGDRNQATANNAIVVGGQLNTASGTCSFIGSGECNFTGTGGGIHTVVVGGLRNQATGPYSFVGGGTFNTASGYISSVVGGANNLAFVDGTVVVGGAYNKACGLYSAVVGGCRNTASGAFSFIGSGCLNIALGCGSAIAGGCFNEILAAACRASIGGGYNNCVTGISSAIGGGDSNEARGNYSTIGGGFFNETCLNVSFVGGGQQNLANGVYATIAGGYRNIASAYSFIGSGQDNTSSADYTAIAGGYLNTASGDYSFIGGGQGNIVEGVHSYAGGLQSCTAATGAQGFAHGYLAKAIGGASAAFGAVQEAVGDNSFVAGGASNSACAQYSFVGGFNNETTTSAKASSVLGENNCVNAPWSFAVGNDNCILGGNVLAVAGGNIVGGKFNKVQGTYSLGNLIMGNYNCIGDGSSNVGGAAAFGGGNCILADSTVAIGVNNNNPVSGQPWYGCNTLLLGCANQAHFGCNSIVGGTNSDGYGTNSIAFGLGATSATGQQQYAFGTGTTNPNNGTTANISNSMVIGSYNVWSITDCHLFAVGDGTADGSRSNALNVSSNGRTGLGCTSPQTRLDVNGTTRTTTLIETSARRYKKNITSLQHQLENIKKLKPVEFEWKETKKKDIGLIAEDVEKIYPQLVEHDDNGDLMGIKYSKITSLLIKAVQEQQEQIDELKKEIFILKQQG